MTKSTRTSDNSGHSFADAQIAAQVRAEPSEAFIDACGLLIRSHGYDISRGAICAVLAAYRETALRGERDV